MVSGHLVIGAVHAMLIVIYVYITSCYTVTRIEPSGACFLNYRPNSTIISAAGSRGTGDLEELRSFLKGVDSSPASAVLRVIVASSASPSNDCRFGVVLSGSELRTVCRGIVMCRKITSDLVILGGGKVT